MLLRLTSIRDKERILLTIVTRVIRIRKMVTETEV